VLGCALVAGTLALPGAQDPGEGARTASARDLLRTVAQVTDSEWAAVGRGEAIAKVLSTDHREVAVAGAVRIAAPVERLVDRYREVENLKRSAIVLDLGRVPRSPRPDDFAGVPFEDYSLDLEDCRPGDCRVRLGAAEIAQFHRAVDWRAADRQERARAVWREVLAGYVSAYGRDGRRALPTFVNKREPLSVPAEVALLVERVDFVAALAPGFYSHLREFDPRGPDGGSTGAASRTEEVIYWSKEDFGVRPVLRISHQTIYRTTGTPGTVLIATNQIYGDHYLDASLTLTVALDASPPGGKPEFYMISVSRARTRSLGGVLRTFVRSTVHGRSRDALRKILSATKASLEQGAAR
jgi:hypothetical protein